MRDKKITFRLKCAVQGCGRGVGIRLPKTILKYISTHDNQLSILAVRGNKAVKIMNLKVTRG